MKINDFSSHIFWSYEKSSELDQDVVIKQVIAYGEVKDMVILARKVEKEKIYHAINNWKGRARYRKHINFMEKVILG